ncbi:MAG: 3-methyladenine DNA glycosylase [Campylobacter sp.]
MTATELFLALKNAGIKADIDDAMWWSGFGTFEIILGAVLIQNTNFKNMQKALENLKNTNNDSLEKLVQIDVGNLALIIKPSGFYNTKAKRLKIVCKAIHDEFGDFENFKQNVSRNWLINLKGIGEETADSILCYACERDEMVVDSYAMRILNFLGYEFQSYQEAKEWLSDIDMDKINKAYNNELSLNEIYAKFHGKIVEFGKKYFTKYQLDSAGEEILNTLK